MDLKHPTNPTRRLFTTALSAAAVAVAVAAAFPGTAQAQAWPTAKPITIVVAYPAGGDSDAMARLYAEKLSARLGQQVVVDNRPGASGTIGSASVAKAPADGYTLLFAPSTFAIAQLTLKVGPNAAHDVNKDFTPIVHTGNVPLLAVTSPASGFKDARGAVAAAKGGKALTYGSPGAGSPMHIAAELWNQDAGMKITHVPYRGSAPVVTDVLGGHIAVGWVTPAVVTQHVAAGRMIPLAVSGSTRSKRFPDVPTLQELGFRNVDVTAWMALLGPKGLPADVTARLNREMNEVLKMPDVMARMNDLGIEPVGGEPAALARLIASDEQRFGKVIKEFGITAE